MSMPHIQLALHPGTVIDFPRLGKSNEWYTPSRYIEAARSVMGSIDLDPASCELANRTVKATRYYSKEDNGLAQEWRGNVWLNPPYSSLTSGKGFMGATDAKKDPTGDFVNKAVCDFKAGKVTQATICVNADVVRNWFQQLWDYLICFAEKKIHFDVPGDGSDHHFFGTAFAYLGPNKLQFIDTFSEFGTVAIRVSKPKRGVTPLSLWEGV